MSISKWKKKYYPIAAAETRKDQAIDHSLRKWEGLKHLKEFGLESDAYGDLMHPDDFYAPGFGIDSDSCALCYHYMKDDDDEYDHICEDCPLFNVRKYHACDCPTQREKISPWLKWVEQGDPKPMIKWLKKAKEAEEKG